MLRCVFLILISLALPVHASIDGPIHVVDGDTWDVGGTRVRLFGIDAPEKDQTCTRANGTTWCCGHWVTDTVRTAFQGRYARCEQVDRDRYDRSVARCSVDGNDANAALVRAGLARAFARYSSDYLKAEREASLSERGIWASKMEAPWVFRSTRTTQPSDPAVGDCRIKGNISKSGKIFHVPGQKNYDRTRIRLEQGERWFCSESDALSAGWRAAKR